MAINVYQVVTDKIIAELEQGRIPWEKPWTGAGNGAWNRVTGKPYSYINQLLLGKPGEWLTYKQANEAGGKVRKGGESFRLCVLEADSRRGRGRQDKAGSHAPLLQRVPYRPVRGH